MTQIQCKTRLRPIIVLLALLMAVIALSTAQSAIAAEVDTKPTLQETKPIFALPGVLRKAQDQPFSTYLRANDNALYGLVGETPEIEDQITAIRDLRPDVPVKIWGTLYPNGRLSTQPEIVVSSIQSDIELPDTEGGEDAESPGSGTSVVIVRADLANVRSGPGTSYPVTGQLKQNQVCPITGRNSANSWWQIDCASGVSGWISDSVVRTVADPEGIPVIAVAPPAVVLPPTPVYNGWKASYFNNPSLQGAPAIVQDVAAINFNWGTGSPHPAVQSDNFSARYERTINFAQGNYRFSASYDDGIRVYIDGQLIIDDWNAGSARTSTADRTLSGNHAITVEYFESTGLASLSFSWAIIDSSSPAPPSTPTNGDWAASYYTNPDLAGGAALVRIEPRSSYPLDKNWGTGSPAPGIIPNDNFSARYRAIYYFDPGNYTFEANSDDGVRVFLDGHLVIDAWNDGPKDTKNTFNGVGAGNHEVLVEYYERTGNASVRVWWWLGSQDSGGSSGGRGQGGYGSTEY